MLLSPTKHALVFHVLEDQWCHFLWVCVCVFSKSLFIKQHTRMQHTPNKAIQRLLTLTVQWGSAELLYSLLFSSVHTNTHPENQQGDWVQWPILLSCDELRCGCWSHTLTCMGHVNAPTAATCCRQEGDATAAFGRKKAKKKKKKGDRRKRELCRAPCQPLIYATIHLCHRTVMTLSTESLAEALRE